MSDQLRTVEVGEHPQRPRRGWLGRAELIKRLAGATADPGLRDDLARLAGDTTDDLGPVR